MNATDKKRRNFIIGGEALIILFQIFAVISAFVKYTPENIIFYCVMVYFTMRNLFSKKPHHICAFLWSLLTAYLLGWLFGAATVLAYWVLYFMKVKIASQHKKEHKDKNTGKAKNENTDTEETGENKKKDTAPISKYAKVPVFRIPIPWITYDLKPNIYKLTKDNVFAEKPLEGDDEAHRFFGKKDPLLLTTVEDYYFSNSLVSKITGTTCFSFKSKKLSDKKFVHWHFMPAIMVCPLDELLTELKQPK